MVKAASTTGKKPASKGAATSKVAGKPASKKDAPAAAVPAADKPSSRKRKVAADFLDLDEPAPSKTVKGAKGKQAAEKAEVAPKTAKAASKERETKTQGKPASKGKAAAPADADEPAAKKVKVARPALTSTRSVGTSKKGLVESAADATTASSSTPLKSALKAAAAPAPVDEDEDIFIHGFSSSDDGGADSSDESDSDADAEGDDRAIAAQKAGKGARRLDVEKLPTIAKDDKSVKRKLEKARKKQDSEKGVLYLGRIPHGFYEDEMRAYFTQFGDVTRLRLARNRKTGASKHFAYIEMSSKSVAEIVAETMDNYLLMGHILKCSVVDPDRLHPDLWLGANKKWRRVPAARVERMTHDKTRTADQVDKANRRLATKESKRKDKIKAAGIDYSFDGWTADAADVSMSL